MQDVVFCIATFRDGTSVRINARKIEVYYSDGEGGTIIRTPSDEYYVKESPEAIDNFLRRYTE